MRTTALAVGLLAGCLSLRAEIIAQWNFNSLVADANTGTGSTGPSAGAGIAALVGAVSASFATGCTNDAAADNSGWSITGFPAQWTSNKLGGIQFNVSTLGYSGIVIRWDQRASSAASKYYRLQYSTDGVWFTDYFEPVVMQQISSRSSYFESQTNRLDFLPEVENCPTFAFRVVSEFESTAIPWGRDGYVTTYGTNNYSRSGAARLDMVTVLGTPIPGANTPPGITGPGAQTLRVEQTAGPLPVTVWDAEDAAEYLLLSASSSDPAVVPESNLWLGGSGAERWLMFQAGNQPGTATVTVCVTDTGSRSNCASFVVAVLPLNMPPFISTFNPTNTLVDRPTSPIPFTIGDLETPPEGLRVRAESANPVLVPNTPENILLTGSGSNRTVTLIPAPGQSGVAPVRITVSDGAAEATAMLPLLVTPSPAVVFYDPFEYPEGSLLTNSGFLWAHRSGVQGQCQVTDGCLQLCSTQTEDVLAPLVGAPYARSNATVLYAGFKVRFLTVPKTTPGLFAHFASGSTLRGRIYAGVTNVWFGAFRLFVANGSDTNTMLPMVLSTNTVYTLVTRYDLDAAQTTLWVNPANEADPGTTATDPQTAISITSYGFRQDSDIGATVRIDDLRVGLSFDSVLPQAAGPTPIPLQLQAAGNQVTLSWTNSAFSLQAAPNPTGLFTNLPGATSPYTTTPAEAARFFRLKAP
jgi:hypothetical protein